MIRVFAQMRFKEKIVDEVVVLKKAPYKLSCFRVFLNFDFFDF